MLSKLIRQSLFYLVHLVLNALVAIHHVYYQFCHKKLYLRKEGISKYDIQMIINQTTNNSKKLKHLVVLVNTNKHSIKDLADIVIWSLIGGISYVSFYDITGDLKKNEETLFLEIERNKKGIPGCIKWANKPDLNGYTNGTKANNVFVNIFTRDDGRPMIANCIKRIVKGTLPSKKEDDKFTSDEFNNSLELVYQNIPDPNLVMYTGPVCCTNGLLPWQIRLTEFLSLSSDHRISLEKFLDTLHRYNKCDQRFGK